MHTIKKNLMALSQAIPVQVMKETGASNVKLASTRTLQFDLAKPGLDGTNRIKVTIEDGKFLLRGYKVEETEILYGVEMDKVADAIKLLSTPATTVA